MSIHYRNDSPNPLSAPGKRKLSTVALLQKRASLALEAADLAVALARAKANHAVSEARDLAISLAELRQRVAKCDLRLAQRIVRVD